MAFNNWDKLSKAQRDYPKPKFAVAVVEKALKKTPDNPYLLSWKADLALQNHQDPQKISLLMAHAHKTVVTDPRLLSYMYRLFLDASRRSMTGGLSSASVGTSALSHWASAAKTMQRKNDRMALWDTLFYTAMQEDCWEDARFALVNYNKEGPPDKRRAHYSLILVTQLAAEQRFAHMGQDDRMARLQADLALKFMKQAYTAPQDDPIAVKDIRDFRFMAEIFKRQDRANELESLWDDPPNEALGEIILHRHRDNLNAVMTKVFREGEDWPLLERHCQKIITSTMSGLKVATDAQSTFWELCAWRWDIWDGLLKAVVKNHPTHEAQQIISERQEECFGIEPQAKDRPVQLTYMRLSRFLGRSLLSDCKAYFEHHAQLGSCFEDLRGFVDHFDPNEASEFLTYLHHHMEKHYDSEVAVTKAQWDAYRQAQLNVLKFRYLLMISRPEDAQHTTIESHFRDTIKLSCLWPGCSDLGFLAVYSLTTLHNRFVCTEGSHNPLDITQNSRLLLQAAMYVRHLVEKDKDKQNRTLCLLAARLHLNIGLGTVAFRLYIHTKCKEMLLDTLSPFILSRISITHPFDVKSYGGFSADEELARVISAIERMESRTNGHLLTDIPSFAWDQAIDILSLKRKLQDSLTRHVCVIERRRVARLRGESVENTPQLEFRTYKNISNNVDPEVFPNFESSTQAGEALKSIMPNGIPNEHWIAMMHITRERSMMALNNEVSYESFFDHIGNNLSRTDRSSTISSTMTSEERQQTCWVQIAALAGECFAPRQNPSTIEGYFAELRRHIDLGRQAMERLRAQGSTGLKPEDEPAMFHENMLMSCYTSFEFLRAAFKLVELIRDKILKPKGKNEHPHKKLVPEKYDAELSESIQASYQAVRDVAQSYIDLLKTRGVRAIKAQVRWGPTGEALKMFLTDDDVEYYAKEYVDSALEAWNGVLKVKLK